MTEGYWDQSEDKSGSTQRVLTQSPSSRTWPWPSLSSLVLSVYNFKVTLLDKDKRPYTEAKWPPNCIRIHMLSNRSCFLLPSGLHYGYFHVIGLLCWDLEVNRHTGYSLPQGYTSLHSGGGNLLLHIVEMCLFWVQPRCHPNDLPASGGILGVTREPWHLQPHKSQSPEENLTRGARLNLKMFHYFSSLHNLLAEGREDRSLGVLTRSPLGLPDLQVRLSYRFSSWVFIYM